MRAGLPLRERIVDTTVVAPTDVRVVSALLDHRRGDGALRIIRGARARRRLWEVLTQVDGGQGRANEGALPVSSGGACSRRARRRSCLTRRRRRRRIARRLHASGRSRTFSGRERELLSHASAVDIVLRGEAQRLQGACVRRVVGCRDSGGTHAESPHVQVIEMVSLRRP